MKHLFLPLTFAKITLSIDVLYKSSFTNLATLQPFKSIAKLRVLI